MKETDPVAPVRPGERWSIPLSLKIAYTLFVLTLVPAYTWQYGLGNFLWFSNVALLLTCVALWLESRLILTMQAISITLPEIVWIIDFFTALVTGSHPVGMTRYMFDPGYLLFIRLLSLYHVVLPPLLVWLVLKLGPDRRAVLAQTLLGWTVLLAAWVLTEPDRNVNWVFGPGTEPQTLVPGWLYLLGLMVFFPICIYLPTYLLLRWVHRRLVSGSRIDEPAPPPTT